MVAALSHLAPRFAKDYSEEVVDKLTQWALNSFFPGLCGNKNWFYLYFTQNYINYFHFYSLFSCLSALCYLLTRFEMGLALQGVCPGGLPSSGAAFGAAAELVCSGSGLGLLVGLMAEEGALIPASCLNPSRDNCTIPTCRAPCDFGGLSCTSCSRSVSPALLPLPCCLLPRAWLGLPRDVWLSIHLHFSLPVGSPSNERLCFSLLGL